jgi:hypothetical protein
MRLNARPRRVEVLENTTRRAINTTRRTCKYDSTCLQYDSTCLQIRLDVLLIRFEVPSNTIRALQNTNRVLRNSSRTGKSSSRRTRRLARCARMIAGSADGLASLRSFSRTIRLCMASRAGALGALWQYGSLREIPGKSRAVDRRSADTADHADPSNCSATGVTPFATSRDEFCQQPREVFAE